MNNAKLLRQLDVDSRVFQGPAVVAPDIDRVGSLARKALAGSGGRHAWSYKSWKAVGIEATLSDPAAQQVDAAKKPAAETDDLLTQNSTDPIKARSEILRLFGLYNYERYFHVIFGSQMRLLEHLRLLGQVGELVADLNKFFAEHQAEGGDSTKDSYFNFLKQTLLMEFFAVGDVNRARITETGLAFLDHIRRTYGPTSNNRMY